MLADLYIRFHFFFFYSDAKQRNNILRQFNCGPILERFARMTAFVMVFPIYNIIKMREQIRIFYLSYE